MGWAARRKQAMRDELDAKARNVGRQLRAVRKMKPGEAGVDAAMVQLLEAFDDWFGRAHDDARPASRWRKTG